MSWYAGIWKLLISHDNRPKKDEGMPTRKGKKNHANEWKIELMIAHTEWTFGFEAKHWFDLWFKYFSAFDDFVNVSSLVIVELITLSLQ